MPRSPGQLNRLIKIPHQCHPSRRSGFIVRLPFFRNGQAWSTNGRTLATLPTSSFTPEGLLHSKLFPHWLAQCIVTSTLLRRNICGYWSIKRSLYSFVGHGAIYRSFASISRPLQVSWIHMVWQSIVNLHFVRQLLVTVVRATFRFHDTTPQGKWYTISILESSPDFETQGHMTNRFGKVRSNFRSLMISDGVRFWKDMATIDSSLAGSLNW